MARPLRVRVRVVPGAARPGIVGRHGDAWKVRVAAPPERGAANDALVALLASVLSIPRGDVRLVSGHGVRDKMVELSGLAGVEAERRLSATVERNGHR